MRDRLGPGFCGDSRPGPMGSKIRSRSHTKAFIAWDGNRLWRRPRTPARQSAIIGVLVGVIAVILISTAFALSIKGTPVGGEMQVNNYSSSDQANPSIASDTSGNFVVVWESDGQDGSGYGVYARMFDATGSPKGSEFIVNSNTTGDQRLPDVSYDDSGNFIVVWQSWGDYWDGDEYATYGIFKREFDSTGVPATPADLMVNIDTIGNQTEPSIAVASSGKHTVVWTDDIADGSGKGVFGRRYSLGPQPPQAIQVNTYSTGSQSQPAVGVFDDASFVVVWCSEAQDGDQGGIYAQAFSSGGAPRGSEFRVNTYITGNQSAPSIAVNETGCYVVAWSSVGQDGDGCGIYCQRFDADHNPLESEFRANTHTAGHQCQSAVACSNNGTFVVVWSSEGQDGSGYGVYGQEFKSNGEPLGPEFRINTQTPNDQSTPDSASDSTGGYVAVWSSNLQDGDGLGVYFQRNVITVIPEFSQIAAMVLCIMAVFLVGRRRRGLQRRVN